MDRAAPDRIERRVTAVEDSIPHDGIERRIKPRADVPVQPWISDPTEAWREFERLLASGHAVFEARRAP